ncbi:MAG: tetratricopeptide repeat protein [Sideroxydans sp.]
MNARDKHTMTAAMTPADSYWGEDRPVLSESLRLHHDGQFAQALALYLWLDVRHSDNADLKFNIGACQQQRRHYSQAVRYLRAALAIDPTLIAAHTSLGEVLREQKRLPEAEAAFRQVLVLDAGHRDALCQLASVLKAQQRFGEAMTLMQRLLEKQPDFTEALLLLGTLHYEIGEIEAAIDLFRRVLALEPDWAQAHFNLSQCLLLQGEFTEGWREHEWRGRTDALAAQERRFAAPPWQGEMLAGKTILLHAEQGLGDTLQFVRYIPLLKAYGATVILECQPQLVRLLANQFQVDQVVARDAPLPTCDFHTPLMRLPYVLGTNLASIPAPEGYLKPPLRIPARLDLAALGVPAAKPRIGVCWAGNADHSNDANRSLRLGLLETALHHCQGQVAWVSLQFGPRAMERQSYAWADTMFDTSLLIEDFADTAALIAQLDLVICVDTAVLHLAGALGCPAWGLLPHIPDSRWLMQRTDSPWYSSMRLFRQAAPSDWHPTMADLGEQLTQWCQNEGLKAAKQHGQWLH